MNNKIWEILNKDKSGKNVVDILLLNRNLKTEKEKLEFFKARKPEDLSLEYLEIDKLEVKKAIARIKLAKKNKEKVVVYGDYDADGVTATAILWEALYSLGLDALPYIPDRFKEGYGINAKSVHDIKSQNPDLKLIITVDNGIVASKEIDEIKNLGIDVIITDHHAKNKIKPKAKAIIHTTKISGSGVSFILSRELTKSLNGLELAAIGTIADQLPLTYCNRSIAKYGLIELTKTKRVGLIELFKQAGIKLGEIGAYEINYLIAPRINSMGRLGHAIDSLRLLCTKDKNRADKLANTLSQTNLERQRIVDEVVLHVRQKAKESLEGIIFLSHETYHEGVIGLAAGRLVEEFYRPAIVVSMGEKFSKGSARSIAGFNIIEVIQKYEEMLVAGGGHPMAAGFTIETVKLEEFREKINAIAKQALTPEILTRKLKIDCELEFDQINWELISKLKEFEPYGVGNPQPNFVTYGAEIIESKLLGEKKNHVKLKLKGNEKFFDAIGFGMGEIFKDLEKGKKIDLVYNLDENYWNGTKSLQLKIKDIKY